MLLIFRRKNTKIMLKTALSISILALAASGVVFVIQNSAPTIQTAGRENQTATSASSRQAASAKPLIEPLDINELKTKKSAAESKDREEIFAETATHKTSEKDNLTELLTKKIGGIIAQNNPKGAETIDGEPWLNTPDPDAIAENIITEATKNFDPNSLKPIIKDSDLKISENSDNPALTSYFQSFNETLLKNSKDIPKELFNNSDKVSLSTVQQTINVYKKTISELYALVVPRKAVAIHKTELELLGKKANILEKIKKYENDPVATLLAAQELEKLDGEFINLKKDIDLFIKNNGNNS